MNRIFLIIFFLIISAVSKADEPRNPVPLKKVTFLLNRLSDDYFFQEMFAGLDQLKNEGLTEQIEKISYDSDPQKLRQKFDQVLNNSGAIIMNYTDKSQVEYFVQQAVNNNIPLIFIFTKPYAKALTDNPNIFYLTQDDVQSGVSQGLMFSEYLSQHPETDKNNDGIINLLNIAGSGYSAPDEAERFTWLLNTINNYPGSTIKVKEIENFPARYGYQPAYDHIIELKDNGKLNSIEAIIAQSDKMAQGVAAALGEIKYKIPVFARGGAPDIKQLIKQGQLVGTVQSTPRQLTYYAGKMAYNYTNGLDQNTDIPYRIYKGTVELPYKIVTAKDF